MRSRASRACARCSLRKVRCDAAESGLPCSRCRLDSIPSCSFIASRRGRYERKKRRVEDPIQDHCLTTTSNNTSLALALTTDEETQGIITNGKGATEQDASYFTADATQIRRQSITAMGNRSSQDPSTRPITSHSHSASPNRESIAAISSNESTTAETNRPSLATMFEDFLAKQNYFQEGRVPKLGAIFFSESSPLTFALGELERPEQPNICDPTSCINREGLTERKGHPAHASPQEISFLKAKGAFDSPNSELSEHLLQSFMERFYPLYSIVDQDCFVDLHRKQELPWILLHAVCFIGATFCNIIALHKAGFRDRWQARCSFYDKAKVLFDVGYETNKVVLLQTVLMLSFWGPQMKSYWNPCSWIGFGVTIAESLGINKGNSSERIAPRTRGLLRRLWWTLAVRDAYCAALLGRPFRINMSQCDTNMLDLSDFNHPADCPITGASEDCHGHCLYQIQIAKLSLILRRIIELRFGASNNFTTLHDLHDISNRWRRELPEEIDWDRQPASNVLTTSLRIIFNHHIIFLYLDKPAFRDEHSTCLKSNDAAFKAAESAAHVISSTAVTLMTNSMVGFLPHETFPGFFIASIVFYRRVRQSSNVYAQLGRAALDNCQMILNAAQERWDPALWAMKIFDFLQSSSGSTSPSPEAWSFQTPVTTEPTQAETVEDEVDDDSGNAVQTSGILHSIDFETSQSEEFTKSFNEFLLMPSYFGAAPNTW